VAWGGLLGLGGWLLHVALDARPAVAATIASFACLAGCAIESGAGRLRIPTVRRQVNEDWLHSYRGWVYGLGFGFQLGVGVISVVTTVTVYVTMVFALLSASLMDRAFLSLFVGAAVVGCFGLSRALPLILFGRARTFSQLSATQRALDEGAGIARVATVAALALMGTALLSVAVV
jgi:hypothetical protein